MTDIQYQNKAEKKYLSVLVKQNNRDELSAFIKSSKCLLSFEIIDVIVFQNMYNTLLWYIKNHRSQDSINAYQDALQSAINYDNYDMAHEIVNKGEFETIDYFFMIEKLGEKESINTDFVFFILGKIEDSTDVPSENVFNALENIMNPDSKRLWTTKEYQKRLEIFEKMVFSLYFSELSTKRLKRLAINCHWADISFFDHTKQDVTLYHDKNKTFLSVLINTREVQELSDDVFMDMFNRTMPVSGYRDSEDFASLASFITNSRFNILLSKRKVSFELCNHEMQEIFMKLYDRSQMDYLAEKLQEF